MTKSHCVESTAEQARIDDSSLFGWSFLVILAMPMTLTINSSSVLLVRVALAGCYESFQHVKFFCVPSTNNFHSCLCALKTCSYFLCRTAACCIVVVFTVFLVVLTVYSVILSWQCDWGMTRRQCKIRWMELECARDCCKEDIHVNLC